MDLLNVLVFAIILGGFVAFVMSLLVKWEFVHWFNATMRRKYLESKTFPKIQFCFLCVSFWICAVLGLLHAIFAPHQYHFWEYILSLPIATLIAVNYSIPYHD